MSGRVDSPDVRESASASGLFGTGLSVVAMSVVLAASVAFFLFFGGPLWKAPAGASHILRIGLSYLLVIPLAAGALVVAKNLSAGRLTSAVGVLWGAKLVITAGLYSLLAPGSGNEYAPAAVEHRAPIAPSTAPRAAYRPSPSPSPGFTLSGKVRERGQAAIGAAVFLELPPPGRALGPARDVEIVFEGPPPGVILASTADHLFAVNRSGTLHTFRLESQEQTLSNLPLVPNGARAPMPDRAAGVYRWSCAVHPAERGVLVVLDHPYGGVTDGEGHFAIEGVPAGKVHLVAMVGTSRSADRELQVSNDTESDLEIGGKE